MPHLARTLAKIRRGLGPQERRAEAMVRRLRRTNARYVPGFGFVPAVRLTVPAGAMQGRLQPKS